MHTKQAKEFGWLKRCLIEGVRSSNRTRQDTSLQLYWATLYHVSEIQKLLRNIKICLIYFKNWAPDPQFVYFCFILLCLVSFVCLFVYSFLFFFPFLSSLPWVVDFKDSILSCHRPATQLTNLHRFIFVHKLFDITRTHPANNQVPKRPWHVFLYIWGEIFISNIV